MTVDRPLPNLLLVEPVRFGWFGNRVGKLRGFDWDRILYPCSSRVVGVEERPGVAGDVDIAEDGVLYVRQEDSLLAGAGDVREREAGERLAWMDRCGFDQHGHVADVDV